MPDPSVMQTRRLRAIPDVVWESAAAVGNPFSVSPVQKGQTVNDLGCGAGADACVAALLAGAAGRVIGIDCTPAMVSKEPLGDDPHIIRSIPF